MTLGNIVITVSFLADYRVQACYFVISGLACYFNIVKRIWKLYSWICAIEINVIIIIIITGLLYIVIIIIIIIIIIILFFQQFD